MSGLFRPYGPVGEFTPSGQLIDVSELGNVPVAPKTIIKGDPGGGGGWTVGVLQPSEIGDNGVAALDVDGRTLLENTSSQVLRNVTTGIVDGGVVTINANPVLFDITAGSGIIVDSHTDPHNPVATEVTWPTQTGVSAAHVGTDGLSYLLINSAGTIVQQQSPPTASQTRTHIVIGTLLSVGGALVGVAPRPIVAFNTGLEALDFIRAVGALNVTGNVFSANGASLGLAKTTGQMFVLGSNYATDPKQPSVATQLAAAPVSFNYIHRDGGGKFHTVVTPTTVIDPDQWDDGSGVLQAVPAGKFTTQVVYVGPGGAVFVYYGQALYDSLDQARAGAASSIEIAEAFDLVLRCWIAVGQGSTDLSDQLQALIIPAGRLGLTDVGGGSTAGETNEGANVGAGGVGPFKGKSGVILEFRNINAGSNKVSVALDGANDEIDIDVVPGNVPHQDLSGAGANTHADIDNHIGNVVLDPHPQYQREDERGAANGYAALDGTGDVPRSQLPDELAYEDENNTFTQYNEFSSTLRAPRKATPGAPYTGEIYVDGIDLKFRDNQGAPADQTVERQARRGVANGYPSLDETVRLPRHQLTPNAEDTGVYLLGSNVHYTNTGSPQSANEIQYTRIWLTAGTTITSLRTFITSGANGARQIQMGIYDQLAQTANNGVPLARIAQTIADTPPNGFTGARTVALTAPYVVSESGWYWIAVQADSNNMNFLITWTAVAGSQPRREESPGVFGLPATAGATTSPTSAILYAAAVE